MSPLHCLRGQFQSQGIKGRDTNLQSFSGDGKWTRQQENVRVDRVGTEGFTHFHNKHTEIKSQSDLIRH